MLEAVKIIIDFSSYSAGRPLSGINGIHIHFYIQSLVYTSIILKASVSISSRRLTWREGKKRDMTRAGLWWPRRSETSRVNRKYGS